MFDFEVPHYISKVFTTKTFEREEREYLNGWDFTVVGVYFALIILTGFYAMYQSNRSTVSGYFLAGRFMTWLPVGASVFASNIGSEHFIGLCGAGAANGFSNAAFELNALLILQMCGWIFLPVFIASKVCTLPGFISKRFGGTRIQVYLAILSMLLYIFTKISVNLFSGAIFINQTIGWNVYVSIVILLAVTSVCTVTGGLTSVMYTETAQSVIMIGGSVTLTVMSLIKIGGFKNLFDKYLKAIPSHVPLNMTECATPTEEAFQLLRPLNDPNMPWLGFILGQTPASIWYWCADQMMVQRLLAAKSLSHAQGGTILAGYLKILPLFIIIIPGMISRILYPEEVACVDPDLCEMYCDNRYGCTNIAYPRLVMGLMPSPLKGLIMSVMLAALMSDLSSIFNSSSTLFTCDIWPRFRKNATVVELMIVGRSFVIVMVAIAIAWVPVIQQMQNGQLYAYIQDVASNFAPPIAAVYIMAVLFKRINEPGAFWSLVVGFVFGVVRMILTLVYMAPNCGEEDTRFWLVKLQYMYFAIFLFWLTVVICWVVSLCTEAPKDYLMIRTTFWTRFDSTDRFDEQEKEEEVEEVQEGMNGKPVSNESRLNSLNGDSIHTNKRNIFIRFINWFCGINNESGEPEPKSEHKSNISSIEQNSKAKAFLLVCMLVVICLAVFIFVFLSIPGWYKLIWS